MKPSSLLTSLWLFLFPRLRLFLQGLIPANPHRQAPSRRPAASSGARPRSAIKISASFGAPIIYLPRQTGSADGVELDLGHMEWHSDFYWKWGEGVSDVGSVFIERTRFEMSGMRLVTVLEGIRGLSATKQAKLLLTIRRPLWDPLARVPYNDVTIHAPALRLAVDDIEYLLLWGVLGSNLSELPKRLPPLFPPPPVRFGFCRKRHRTPHIRASA